MERRLAAVMIADVAGYGRLSHADEEATRVRFQADLREVFEPRIAQHHGRLVKTMGDGLLVEFHSVVDAVRCAIEVQRAKAARNKVVGAEHRLAYRIGINLGDVMVEGDDIHGDGINIAARLEPLCDPGGVLISGTAYDQLQGKLDLPLDPAGTQHVKNIAHPVRTYRVRLDHRRPRWRLRMRPYIGRLRWTAVALVAVLAIGAVWWWVQSSERPGIRPSIAVLPFNNLGGDEATNRLADGITEDIITDLSRIPEFDVIARNSTAVYEDTGTDFSEIAKALSVRFIFKGSIQREGEQIRVSAQLIDAQSGSNLWSQRWDRRTGDVFAVQAEIAEQVASHMQDISGPIHTVDLSRVRRKPPENLSSYELYLLGREKLSMGRRDDIADAIGALTQAVEVDPNFARAWVELAWAHNQSSYFVPDRAGARLAARAAAERAVSLDPGDAEAHAVLGNSLGMEGDLSRAEAEFDAALRLNSGDFEILTFYAGWASSFGEPERGAQVADRAIRLNPNYEPWTTSAFGYAYFMAGRYDDAVTMLAQKRPEDYSPDEWVRQAASLAALEREADAKTVVASALRYYPDITIEGFSSDPGYNDAERDRLIETMRLAGFPACAAPKELVGRGRPVHLPECQTP